MDLAPEDVPEKSRYLLEVDFSQLARSSHKDQAYWVVAVQAAKRAGRRLARRLQSMPAAARRVLYRILEQIHSEIGVGPPLSRRRPRDDDSSTVKAQERVKRPKTPAG